MKTKFLCPRFPSLKVVLRPDAHVLKEGIPYHIRGKRATFRRGVLVTEDMEVIKRIRSSEKFGSAIIEVSEEEERKIERRTNIQKRATKLAEKEIAE